MKPELSLTTAQPQGYVFPTSQLGYLSPLPVVDAMHHEFYQAVPHGMVFLSYALPVSAFTEVAALKAVARADEGFDYLKRRNVDRVIFGGLPVSSFVGRAAMLQLMKKASDKYGFEVSNDFEDTIEALRHLGAHRVAVAAKWRAPVMDAVVRYLTDAGLDVAGSHGSDYDAADVMLVDTVNSVGAAIELGRGALEKNPGVDALVLGGGTWLAIPATSQLEKEFGLPVVSNMLASSWSAARFAGVETARHLACRLLEKA